MYFYLIFSFLGFKVVDKQTMNLFYPTRQNSKIQSKFTKVVKISDFRFFSGWIEKCKPALSRLGSSWDNSYCVRLLIVSLDVKLSRLQFLVSEVNFFCCVFSDIWNNFLLWDVINQLRIQKSIVDSCFDKKFSDWLSSFETCWSSLLRLLMALRRSLLCIDKASLFEIFGSLKDKELRIHNKLFAIVEKINV